MHCCTARFECNELQFVQKKGVPVSRIIPPLHHHMAENHAGHHLLPERQGLEPGPHKYAQTDAVKWTSS